MSPRTRLFLVFLALLLLLAIVAHPLWLRWLGEQLVSTQRAGKSDAIFVFAGDWRGNRIIRAAQLFREGYAPIVLVSSPNAIYGRPEGALAIEYARQKGFADVPFEELRITSFSTREEVALIAPIIRQRGVGRLLAVTSDYHTRRAGRLLRDALGPGVEVRMVGAPDPYFKPSAWWHDREGMELVFYEWTKTLTGLVGI